MDKTAQDRYDELAVMREPYVRTARDCAALTIKALMPPEGHNIYSKLPETYQDFGSRLVLNLASRLLLALYPPGIVPFSLDVAPEVLMESGKLTPDENIAKQLALLSKTMNAEIERKVWRKPTFLSLLYLLVTGNVLERMMEDNTLRVYRLDQYVVVRDLSGTVMEVILKETVNKQNLPEELRGLADKAEDINGKVALYSVFVKKGDEYEVHQEIGTNRVPGSQYTTDVLPVNPIRWTDVIGEDYGRGKVEEHLDDLRSVEGLMKSVIDGSAMAARNITMVRPNAAGGLNLRRRLAKAQNGDILVGNPEDIAMLKYDNLGSMQFIESVLAELKRELASSFLLNSSVQRSGERVTAYEIQKMAEELEGALGGTYTMLSADMQGTRIRRLMLQMQKQGKLPSLGDDIIEPTILTGLESLGREKDVQRVVQAIQITQQMPEEGQMYVKWPSLLTKVFNGLQLPDSVRDEGEVQKLLAQRQQQQLQQGLLEEGGRAAIQAATQGGQ